MNEELENLIKVQGFIEAARMLVQGEGLVGGHRGNVDDWLTSASNDVYDRIEELKNANNQQR